MIAASEIRARKQWISAVIAIGVTAVLAVLLAIWRPSHFYDWFKAIHVMAVIAWMAGLLYLPRLFVYHCGAEPGSRQSETFKMMERRLLRGIMNPAMIASWFLGLWMLYVGYVAAGGFASAHWLHVKLALVIATSGFHRVLARWTGDFAADHNVHSERFYRIVNEVPAVLMIGIVIMVVIKPF